MRHILMLAATFAAWAASPAFAEGIYTGGSLGMSRTKIEGLNAPAGAKTDRKNSTGKIVVGQKLITNFAVEAGYARLGESSVTQDPGYKATVRVASLFVDAVGIVPLNDQLSFTARFGLARNSGRVTNTAGRNFGDAQLNIKYGIGVSYELSDQWAVTADLEQYRYNFDGVKGKINMLSVGANYTF